jgi:hypothetical protein
VDQGVGDARSRSVETRRPVRGFVPRHVAYRGPRQAGHLGQVGPGEVCSPQYSLYESGSTEHGLLECRAVKRRPREIGAVELGSGQVGVAQIAVLKVGNESVTHGVGPMSSTADPNSSLDWNITEFVPEFAELSVVVGM